MSCLKYVFVTAVCYWCTIRLASDHVSGRLRLNGEKEKSGDKDVNGIEGVVIMTGVMDKRMALGEVLRSLVNDAPKKRKPVVSKKRKTREARGCQNIMMYTSKKIKLLKAEGQV